MLQKYLHSNNNNFEADETNIFLVLQFYGKINVFKLHIIAKSFPHNVIAANKKCLVRSSLELWHRESFTRSQDTTSMIGIHGCAPKIKQKKIDLQKRSCIFYNAGIWMRLFQLNCNFNVFFVRNVATSFESILWFFRFI